MMAEKSAECSPVSTCEIKVFNDPIHGHIELHPLCVKIIDTPQFQRLRYIKQLGGCYYVFPGASHNRFEHCIGVCHLAGQLIRAIKQRQPELDITEEDVLSVQIAGLCHDLGHGPFSHMFQDFIHKVRPDHKWEHEQASVQVFEHLLLKNNLKPTFVQYGLDEKDITFIKEQIAGPLEKGNGEQNWPYHGRDKQKCFLYEVVANKRNGIDVDKWDYFARDCYYLGVKSSFDHNRFISFCRVIEADKEMQICNRDKEVANIYDMFYVRSILHSRAYQHKTAKVIEFMITEALEKADKYLLTEGRDGQPYLISKSIDDVEAFLKLTDTIYHRILYSSDPKLSEARHVLEQIESRKLYKYVGQTKPNKASADIFSENGSATIRQQMASFSPKDENDKPFIMPDDIIVIVVKIDYGKDEKNPIDQFRFYTKADPQKGIQIKQKKVSLMLPEIYGYKYMLVYSRKLDTESIQHVSHCFRKWCEKND